MKRTVLSLLLLTFLFIAALCGGKVTAGTGGPYASVLYTDQEIEAAMTVTKQYFRKNFDGCTLTELTYGGDEKSRDHTEFADRHGADEVIVLLSSFDVDASGGDGSLNPNSTYTRWMWILVRNSGGPWRHADHGY